MNPAALAVEGASLRLGAFGLRGLSLRLAPGEILAILGPNGAGKSVALEAIAGFHRLAAGRIAIGGRDVTDLPPERRRIGLVVQNFGLFPHLTVARNVGFALPRGAAAAGQVAALLDRFGIAALARRYPPALSPGEKQRVALARALAARPDLFLFDEPFSALDAGSREQLRDELARFLRDAAIAAIFVTHDHAEAHVLADRVVVMRDGAVVQSGAPAELFRRPADRWTAEFLGIDNILPGRVVEGARIAVGERMIHAADASNLPPGRNVWACVRAEDVGLHRPGAPVGAALGARCDPIAGRVTAVNRLGVLVKVSIDCGFPLHAYLTSREWRRCGLDLGAAIVVAIAAEAIHLLPRD